MRNRIAIALALILGACNVTLRDGPPADPQAAILAAQIRRAQILAELEHLERLLRRTVTIDGRAVIQSSINRHRFELEQLNAIVQP